MKFKIDENLPVEIVDALRQSGHDAVSVLDQGLGGKVDDLIIDVCQSEGRTLVTLDRDFSNIGQYPHEKYAGIIVISVGRQSKRHLLETLNSVLPLFETEQVMNRLWIVEESRVRIRGGSPL